MSSADVGTAFVRVLPDVSAFAKILTAEVNAAVLQAQAAAKPIIIPLSAAGGAQGVAAANASVATTATAAASATKALGTTQELTARDAARLAAAELSVARADSAATAATAAYTKALGANATAQELATLAQKEALALQALNVAQLRQQAVLNPAVKASKGLGDLGTKADVARGSLIGLSRITPLTVFGLNAVGTAAIVAGTALAASVASAAKFEQLLNTFQAVTQSTDQQMKLVSDTALALGADLSLPATSANDAAVALTELSKAGLSVEDSLAAARGVLQLATAANISAGDAAIVTATQLNAFKLGGDQAVRSAELLADASISAQGEISDFAAGLAQAGAAAQQSGVSIEDTTALLTQLGIAGIKGADGGTSLRTFLLRLVPTTKEAAQYTKALGIELDQTKTIGSQLPDVIEQYRRQLQLLNPQQQTLVLNQIFGQDAFRAASVIFNQEEGALRALTDEFERSNALQDLSAAKAKGLSGAFGGLKSQLETLGTDLGLIASGPLEAFIRGMSDSLKGVEIFAAGIGELIGELSDLAGIPVIKKVITFEIEVGGKSVSLKDFLLFSNPATAPFAALAALGGGGEDRPEDFGLFDNVLPSGLKGGVIVGRGRKDAGASQTEQQVREAIFFRSEEGKRTRARLAKLQADAANADEALKGIPIPKALQQAQVDAQIKNSLQAELAADNAILQYLERKRSRLEEGTKAFLVASRQVEEAQAQRDSVLNEIKGNQERAQNDQKELFLTTLQNQETRLQLAAEASGNQGSAEAALIAFYKRQSENAALTTSLQLAYLGKYQDELEKQKQAVVAASKAQIDLRNEILNTKLSAALLTDTKEDDNRIYQQQITALEDDIKRQKTIARKAAEGTEARINALIQVQKDLQRINQLKGIIKGNLGDSGFSINDLFKEALNQFNEFGSNVSSSVTTPGGVRGALGGAIAAQNPKLTQADQVKIQKASTTNDLLAQILATLQRNDQEGTSVRGNTQVGRLTAKQAAGLAARRVGGT